MVVLSEEIGLLQSEPHTTRIVKPCRGRERRIHVLGSNCNINRLYAIDAFFSMPMKRDTRLATKIQQTSGFIPIKTDRSKLMATLIRKVLRPYMITG